MAKTQNIKQKQYCNKFHKDLKNGPHQEKHPQKTFFFFKGDVEEKDTFRKTVLHQLPLGHTPLEEGGLAHSKAFRHPGPIPAGSVPCFCVPRVPAISGRAPRENEDTGRRWWVVWILAAPAPMRVEQERKDKMDK